MGTEPGQSGEEVDEGGTEQPPAIRELNRGVLHPAGGRSVADFAEVFETLGHPARIGVLYTLLEREECTYSALSRALDAEDNELNHHLRRVVESPLVRKTPSTDDGRKSIYRLTRTGVRITEYVVEMMETERDAIEDEYLDAEHTDS
ncbi:hypothetical protein BRC81_06945 [Halobacteriales archaeon QS_1_68_20]|nr:MAG: hypothetical protein BRC81_06945 [Halobacteriales archaeon QS_1_68_20]